MPAAAASRDSGDWLAIACCVAMSVVLGWIVVQASQRAACTNGDKFLVDLCPAPSDSDVVIHLRDRIARNAGDTMAYRDLALADRSDQHNRTVATAIRLAPFQPQLMLHRAAAAMDRNDPKAAVPHLMNVANFHEIPIAARSLAQLVVSGQGQLLEPYLEPGARWLPKMLVEMRATGGHFSAALPLIAKALRRGALEPATARQYLRELKAAKAWGDAYGLWLAMLGKPVPALFNGGFDEPFDPDGFDWEVRTQGQRRAGAWVERRGAQERGAVLDIQFSGRPIALPMARQQLFLGPGRYRLRGEMLGRQFRIEHGLLWAVYCDANRIAASPPLRDTGGLWKPFEFEFQLAPSCGLVATLQLQTADASEAVIGARGRVAFDSLSLERLP